jgi:PadR family transcriptional regulator PadR
MPSESRAPVALLQGSLDLILLRALELMGRQHSYALARRLEQVSDAPFLLNQGTLYPALIRLEQRGWIKGHWDRTETGRAAKFYEITKTGSRALRDETARWRRLTAFVDKLLVAEP